MSLLRHGSSVTDSESIVYYLDFSNKRSFKFPQRIYDYGEWVEGDTGSLSKGVLGDNSIISKGLDPWGNNINLVESFTDGSGNGEIKSGYITPEIDKLYRISYWENRVSNGGLTTGISHFFGINQTNNSSDEGYNVATRADGNVNTNPYFFSQSSFPSSVLPEGEWVLMVGHIWPVNSGTGEHHPDTGIWTRSGTRLHPCNREFTFLPYTDKLQSRNLCLYRHANPDPPAIHHTAYPRIDVCDGTEPSLNDLLNNNTDKAFNLINPSNEAVLINGPIFEDKGLKFDGVNDYVKTDFGEGIDLGVEELTVDLWVKPGTSLGEQPLFASGWTTPSNRRFYVAKRSGQWQMGIGEHAWSTGPSIPDGWNNLVLTCNSYNKTVKMYLNGEFTGHEKTHGGFQLIENIVLGTELQTLNVRYFEGVLGAFRVYNKILSDENIMNNFQAFRGRFGV